MIRAVPRWLEARRPWQRWALAFLAGALGTCAFAPLYLVPVLFVAFPAAILLTDASRSLKGAFATGWFFGFGHFLTGFYWVASALEIAGAPPAAALALPLGMALYSGFAALLYKLLRRWTASRVLLFAVCWALGEWLRGHVITGFPWNLAAYSWAFSDAMSQTAALLGAYGMTLVTVAIAAAPVSLAASSATRRARWAPLGGAAVAMAVMLVFGLVRLGAPMPPPDDRPNVRLVQPDIAQDEKWLPQNYHRNYTDHLELSRSPGAGDIDLFAWSEAAIPYQLDQDQARRAEIASVGRPGAVVVTGFPRVEEDEGGRSYYNSMIFIGEGGRTLALFDKSHLVPFGEYVPLKGLFRALDGMFEFLGLGIRFEKVVEGGGDFVPGSGPRVIQLPGLPSVSPLICYEVIFPGAVIPSGERPAWLLNITNDAWYGEWAGPYQHLAIARFRSIEEGLPMVRAAGTGVSAIIDARGRVVNSLGLGERGVVDGALPPAVPPPLYARLGDLVFWILLAGAAILAMASGRKTSA